MLAGVGTLLLVLVGLAASANAPGFVFYTPSLLAVAGLAVAWVGAVMVALALAPPSDTPERLEVRRALAAARAFFRHELTMPEPRLDDAWYPYLLAFGLEGQAESWFRSFGAEQMRDTAWVGGYGGSRSSSTWTGGGPTFGGGGGFGGGGAGRGWGAAVGGMAAGVSAPSSSGSGGGSSGGGGGGGW